MATKPNSDEQLQQTVDLIAAHGSVSAAARSLGISYSTLESRKRMAETKGFKPKAQALLASSNASPPEGYKLKGTSTLFDADGVPRLQWVKTDAQIEKLQAMQRAAFEALCEKLEPIPRIAAPRGSDKNLATLYTITDAHIGMLAWDKESGEDWDLTIAERVLVGTFVKMIDTAPPSAIGLVNELGDYEHFDSLAPMTPTNHHILDADSRFQKMIQVSTRILRRIIEHALTRHDQVHVQIKEGNHDPASSAWKRVMFSMLYERNPRVHINMSPNPYSVFEHGRTLLGFHHGHLSKFEKIDRVFSSQFRAEWGRCPYVYIHMGHLHHVHEKEFEGATVIQHPTLATKDAYAARYGFLSKRQATSMTYSKTTGEYARATFIPVK